MLAYNSGVYKLIANFYGACVSPVYLEQIPFCKSSQHFDALLPSNFSAR